MSELINTVYTRHDFRRRLLMTVSLATLATVVNGAGDAKAAGVSGSSLVWIELGTQLESISGGNDPWVPSFAVAPQNYVDGTAAAPTQKAPLYSFGGEGKLSLEPAGTDWILSVAIRYGRSQTQRGLHTQTAVPYMTHFGGVGAAGFKADYDTTAKTGGSHAIIDFEVGRDVGLGIPSVHSTLAIGIRVAQFTSTAHAYITSKVGAPPYYSPFNFFQRTGTSHIKRSFRGIGPSISWDASVPLSKSEEGLSLDWGAKAAILFGKQKASVDHVSYERGYGVGTRYAFNVYTTNHVVQARRKQVIVPNVGGFAGISYRLPSARLSIGYRADVFFGAVDAGVDARHSKDRAFFGPFASVSVGIGG